MFATKTLCYVINALLSVLLVIGLTLLFFEMNKPNNLCGFANKEIIDIVNLEDSTESGEEQDRNRTESIDFTGKYKMIKSENFDKFLEELGVSFFLRTIANKAVPEYEITRNGDMFTLKTISTFKTSEISFKLNGEEFEENRLDGIKAKSSVVQRGNKWIQTQSGDNKVVKIIREFNGEELRVTGAINNVGFVRIYKKIS